MLEARVNASETVATSWAAFPMFPTCVGLPFSCCLLHRSTRGLWGRGPSPDPLRALAQAKLFARGSQTLHGDFRCILVSFRIFFTFSGGLGWKYSKFRMERWKLAPMPPAWANSRKCMVSTPKSAAEEGGCDGCPAQIAHSSRNPGFHPVAEFAQLAPPPPAEFEPSIPSCSCTKVDPQFAPTSHVSDPP